MHRTIAWLFTFIVLPATAQVQYFRQLRYGLFTPPVKEKTLYPLVVYLHGANDTVSRGLALYSPVWQAANPCFVVTPKCIEPNQGWGNTWQTTHTEVMATTLALVDSLVQVLPIDTARLYIYGISMGGFGVFSALQKNPGKFAAAYAVCGGSDSLQARALLHTPLWLFHGSEDNIVPVWCSRGIYHEIVKAGGQLVRYTEYPDVKHNSWENAGREPLLWTWLFSQRKGYSEKNKTKIKGFVAETAAGNKTLLRWNAPAADKIWFYRLSCNGQVFAEVDGSMDHVETPLTGNYQLVTVNFYGQPSAPVTAKTSGP